MKLMILRINMKKIYFNKNKKMIKFDQFMIYKEFSK